MTSYGPSVLRHPEIGQGIVLVIACNMGLPVFVVSRTPNENKNFSEPSEAFVCLHSPD